MLIRLFFACILVFTDLEVLSMLHEVSFHSFNGRDEVQGWVYVPACKPKGIVQVIHGFGEHSRRYFHMIVKFMDAGYIVAADDLTVSAYKVFIRKIARKSLTIFAFQQTLSSSLLTGLPG